MDRKLPIITDGFVDPQFGTGAVKITPAHDHNDYEVGVRHKLPFINVISDEGLMLDNCGEFSGLKRFDARKKVLDALKKNSLFRELKEHEMIVPICRCEVKLIYRIYYAQVTKMILFVTDQKF